MGSRRHGAGAPCLRAILMPDRDGAAAFGLAAVLPGAPVVAALAAAQPLAGVLALAIVPIGGQGAPALPLAAVLPGARVVPGLAPAHPPAPVHALAGMMVHDRLAGLAPGQHQRAARQTRGRGRDRLRKRPTTHSVLHRSSKIGFAPDTDERPERILHRGENEE